MGGLWMCEHCTMQNEMSSEVCIMCALPPPPGTRNQAVPSLGMGDVDVMQAMMGGQQGFSSSQDALALLGMAGMGQGGGAAMGGLFQMFNGDIKNQLVLALQTSLLQTRVPASEGKVDTEMRAVGEIQYSLGEIVVVGVDIPPDQVDVRSVQEEHRAKLAEPTRSSASSAAATATASAIEDLAASGAPCAVLTASNVSVKLGEFVWHYDKLSKPSFSSGGLALCSASKIEISIVVQLSEDGLKVASVEVDINNLNIDLKDTKLKWIYDLLISAFKGRIKRMLQNAMRDMAKNAVESNLAGLM